MNSANRIAKLRAGIATAMKEGAVVGDTAKGLVNGLNSIQRIYGKYEAKGPFTSTQLSDLSKLVDQEQLFCASKQPRAPRRSPRLPQHPATACPCDEYSGVRRAKTSMIRAIGKDQSPNSA